MNTFKSLILVLLLIMTVSLSLLAEDWVPGNIIVWLNEQVRDELNVHKSNKIIVDYRWK
jgi:hypothetical protein